MTDQFVDVNKMVPITPTLELVEEWANASARTYRENGTYAQHEFALATQAARWGADQELEACCEWLKQNCGRWDLPVALRDARRSKPPSLKEQALEAFEKCWNDGYLKANQADVIRTALESLPS